MNLLGESLSEKFDHQKHCNREVFCSQIDPKLLWDYLIDSHGHNYRQIVLELKESGSFDRY